MPCHIVRFNGFLFIEQKYQVVHMYYILSVLTLKLVYLNTSDGSDPKLGISQDHSFLESLASTFRDGLGLTF